MTSVFPVEHPFWFSVVLPADPRMLFVLRDLSGRIGRQVGCAPEDADSFGGALVDAVTRAIERGAPDRRGARVEVVFRVRLSAFEVAIWLKGNDDHAAAALASLDPEAVWPVEILKKITDRFEISRDPEGSRCSVTRPISAHPRDTDTGRGARR